MTFEKYYPQQYNEHLLAFLKAAETDDIQMEQWRLNTHDFDQHNGHLTAIPEQNLEQFLLFLALEVLMDEAVFTHFAEDYSSFRERTLYPKIDFCGHGRISRNPWSVFSYLPRSRVKLTSEDLRKAMLLFFSEQKVMLDDLQLEQASFPAVIHALLHDEDVFNAPLRIRRVLEEVLLHCAS